jgi:general secretion pathway protein C
MFFFHGPVFSDEKPPDAQDLGLKLVGTAVSNDSSLSLAVLEDIASGKQGSFSEGGWLWEMRIKKISFGQVVIDTGSGEVVLSLRRSYPAADGPTPGEQTGQLDAEEVDAVIPDYKTLMQQIRVRSQFVGGRPAGFVIYRIEPGSIFERMGLENSDVIVKVNGRPITSSQPVAEFYEALIEGGTVTLDVRREDRMQELIFEIR